MPSKKQKIAVITPTPVLPQVPGTEEDFEKKLKAAFESENPVVTPVVTQTGTISTPILVVDPTPELVIVNEPVTKPHISHKRKRIPNGPAPKME
ncbi:MAG: hypothetical protein WB421_13460, partial [Terriglobales bacterium]